MDTESLEDVMFFTPETLGIVVKLVEELRHDILCSIDPAGADAIAEQFYIMAVTNLEQAQRHFELAKITQSRVLVKR